MFPLFSQFDGGCRSRVVMNTLHAWFTLQAWFSFLLGSIMLSSCAIPIGHSLPNLAVSGQFERAKEAVKPR